MRANLRFGSLSLFLCLNAGLVACVPVEPSGESQEGGTTTSPGSTSSTSTTDPDPTTETETSGGTLTTNFVPNEDYPDPNECDSFLQDCAPGEKCVPYSTTGGTWDANKCVPVMGDQAPGEPCTYGGTADATDDCDATSGCWDVQDIEGEMVGICLAFCTGSPDDPMCEEGTTCLISADGPIAYCVYTCDPLLQDCNPGLGCYWAGSGFNCIFSSEETPIGEPCGFVNSCANGSLCTSGEFVPGCEESACCSQWCDLGDPSPQCDALPGSECLPFFEDGTARPGYENVGICILPDPNP